VALTQVQGQLAEVAAVFLARVQPKGAGALSFGLSQGKLVLLGAQMGEQSVDNVIAVIRSRARFYLSATTLLCVKSVSGGL
jgi:hypothetical protein